MICINDLRQLSIHFLIVHVKLVSNTVEMAQMSYNSAILDKIQPFWRQKNLIGNLNESDEAIHSDS